MENQLHHGKIVFSIAKEKGFNKTKLANALQMSRVGLDYHLNKQYWNKEVLEQFAKVLEISVSDIVNRNVNNTKQDYQEEYFKLLRTTNHLWNVLNQYGIKVELPNFNYGELMPTYGTVFFGANNP